MTRQEVFDKVADHLLNQGQKSLDEQGHCVYRGEHGLKCSVGCLIKDEYYSPELELKTIGHEAVIEAVQYSLQNNLLSLYGLIKNLQSVHDFQMPYNWLACLYKVADTYALKKNILDRHYAALMADCHYGT